MTGIILQGILIEGHNYSGKSTVAELLRASLESSNHPVSARHGTICSHPLLDDLKSAAMNALSNWEVAQFPDSAFMRPFNVHKSAQIMIDSELARSAEHLPHPDNRLIVQDRHWLSQVTTNEFFNPGEGLMSREWIKRSAPRFLLHVYLTCSLEAREERAAQRGPATAEKHHLNRYLRLHLEGIQALDVQGRKFAESEGDWIIFDTSSTPAADLAAELTSLILARAKPTDSDQLKTLR